MKRISAVTDSPMTRYPTVAKVKASSPLEGIVLDMAALRRQLQNADRQAQRRQLDRDQELGGQRPDDGAKAERQHDQPKRLRRASAPSPARPAAGGLPTASIPARTCSATRDPAKSPIATTAVVNFGIRHIALQPEADRFRA